MGWPAEGLEGGPTCALLEDPPTVHEAVLIELHTLNLRTLNRGMAFETDLMDLQDV